MTTRLTDVTVRPTDQQTEQDVTDWLTIWPLVDRQQWLLWRFTCWPNDSTDQLTLQIHWPTCATEVNERLIQHMTSLTGHYQPVTWTTDIINCPNSVTPTLTGSHHDRHKHQPVRPTLGPLNAVQICKATDCSSSSCHFCTPAYVTCRLTCCLFTARPSWYTEHHYSSADQCVNYIHSMWLVPRNITTTRD